MSATWKKSLSKEIYRKARLISVLVTIFDAFSKLARKCDNVKNMKKPTENLDFLCFPKVASSFEKVRVVQGKRMKKV